MPRIRNDQLVNSLKSDFINTSAGGGGGAGSEHPYLTISGVPELTSERILTAGDGLSSTDGGAGNTFTLDLQTPGAISATTSDDPTGSHTHSVIASSDPGQAVSLLETDANGKLTLFDLVVDNTLGVGVDTPGETVEFRNTGGTQFRISYSATEYLNWRVDQFGDLFLTSTGTKWWITGDVSIRLDNNTWLGWRNAADSLDYQMLTLDSSDYFKINNGGGAERVYIYHDDGSAAIEIRPTQSIFYGADGDDAITIASDAKVGVNEASPSATMHITNVVAPQLRVAYDGSNYFDINVNSNGNVEFEPIGDIVVDPQGDTVLPELGYDISIGTLQKKFLELHAAELWVETLVAQETIATIGGRILVGPTTEVTSDFGSSDTTVEVKHNEMAYLDNTYMESNGKVEFFRINAFDIDSIDDVTNTFTLNSAHGDVTSLFPVGKEFKTLNASGGGAVWTVQSATFNGTNTLIVSTITPFTDHVRLLYTTDNDTEGPYRYINIDRNQESSPSGSNDWYAGDAMFNTGQTGDGFIDLYSIGGVTQNASHTTNTHGPTIVGNVRNSNTFNDWNEHWAIGNLKDIFGYAVDTYGVAFGEYGNANYMTIDSTDGIRFYDSGHTVRAQLTSDTWTLGNASLEHVEVTPTALSFKDGATTFAQLSGTTWTIGQTTAEHIQITSSALQFKDGATVHGQLSGTTWTLGQTGNAHVQITSTKLSLIDNSGSEVIVLGDSGSGGDSYFAGIMEIDTGGEIRQGSGTLGSNFTGLRIWNDGGIGRIGGYNSNALQWYANTDGRLYAGGGSVQLDSTGFILNYDIVGTPTFVPEEAVRFVRTSDDVIVGRLFTQTDTGGNNTLFLSCRLDSVADYSFLSISGDDAARFSGDLSVDNDLAVDTNTLFVDASANRVGVNDSTPSFNLDVAGDARVTSNLGVGTSPNSNYGIAVSGGSTAPLQVVRGSDGEFIRMLDSGNRNWAIGVDGTGLYVQDVSGTDVTMFWSESGDVSIGHSPPTARLSILEDAGTFAMQVTNDGNASNRNGIQISGGQDSNPSHAAMGFYAGNTTTFLGGVIGDGSGGVNYTSSSDERLKEDVRDLASGLDIARALRPVTYRGKGAPPEQVRAVGLIAQEVNEIAPEVVAKGPDGEWGIDYGRLTPILIAAIRELENEIEQLKQGLNV